MDTDLGVLVVVDLPVLVQLFQGGALLAIVIAFLQEWIVPGTRYRHDTRELRRQIQAWQQIALGAVTQNEKATGILERLASSERVT